MLWIRFLFITAVCVAAGVAHSTPTVDAALSQDPIADPEYPATMAELAIPVAGQRLPAHLYIASGAGPHPTVVLLHGFPGNERNLDLAQALRRFGFNVLFFHYRGAWGAEGEYSVLGQLSDIDAVLAYLREPENAAALRVDAAALSVLGHSLGGFMALAVGTRDASLQCVLALSPANLALFRDAMGDGDATLPDLAAYADALFMLRGLTAQRFASELRLAPIETLDTRLFGPQLAGKAVFLGVGDADTVTPAAQMFTPLAAAYAKVPGLELRAALLPGDHSFSGSRIALAREVLSWAGEHCR
jgi:hypothetical protein